MDPIVDRLAERIEDIQRRMAKIATKREQLDREYKDYERDLESLRRVADRSLLTEQDPAENGENHQRHGELRRLVVGVIEEIELAEFSAPDIIKRLDEANPGGNHDRASVSSCLSRLAVERHLIEEKEPGRGRRAAVYRRTNGNSGVAA